MYCTNCGKESVHGEKFCTVCGTQIGVPAEQLPVDAPTEENVPCAAEDPVTELPGEELPVAELPITAEPEKKKPKKERKSFNIFAIIGFVLSLVCCFAVTKITVLIPLAGLIFSIVALVQIKKSAQRGKGLAIAGVILGAITTVIAVVVAIFSALFSYAIPGIFKLIINYLAPELLSLVGAQVEASITDIIRDIIGEVNLSELLKQLIESMF